MIKKEKNKSKKLAQNEFYALKNKTLYALNNSNVSDILIEQLKNIKKIEKLNNFINVNLNNIVTRSQIENTTIGKNKNKKKKKLIKLGTTFPKYKASLIQQLVNRNADPVCIKMLKTKSSKVEMVDYIKKFLRDEISFLDKKGFEISNFKKKPTTKKNPKNDKTKNLGWVNMISVPMRN